MNEQQEMQKELLSRLDLMESMVQEGRRSIGHWGWGQVLWGAAYLIAIGWSYWSGNPSLAWPVTMIAAFVVTIVVARTRPREHRQTTVSRALNAVWIAMAIAIFLYCFAVGVSGHCEIHSYLAGVETFLGLANFASAMILRWRLQFVVAFVWWAAAVATCFASEILVVPILVAATLVGMIGFGIYLMYRERRERRLRVLHA